MECIRFFEAVIIRAITYTTEVQTVIFIFICKQSLAVKKYSEVLCSSIHEKSAMDDRNNISN